MQVTMPNSVAASDAMPRYTSISRPATRKCSTLPTYLRTIRPAAIVASRYSPTMLPSNSQLKCVIRLLPFFGVLSEALPQPRTNSNFRQGNLLYGLYCRCESAPQVNIIACCQRLLYRQRKGILQLGSEIDLSNAVGDGSAQPV